MVIRHPGQVCLRRTRAGVQKVLDYGKQSLDSGSRPAKRRSSGMTGSSNFDTVSTRKYPIPSPGGRDLQVRSHSAKSIAHSVQRKYFFAMRHADHVLAVLLRGWINFASEKGNDAADEKGKHKNCQQ